LLSGPVDSVVLAVEKRRAMVPVTWIAETGSSITAF
jgi:hypothetical protein